MSLPLLAAERKLFHSNLLTSLLFVGESGVPSNADGNNRTSIRIASLALGTGDIDCVDHFALDELRDEDNDLDNSEAQDLLAIMVEGKRLKDIADLPLDLAV